MNFQAQRDPGETHGIVVEQTFDALDNNYDDSLSQAEFLAGALKSPSSKDSVANGFTTVDKNSDGEISRSEFITAAQGSQEMLGLSKGFRLADADRDGFLSQEEFFFISRQFYPLEWQNILWFWIQKSIGNLNDPSCYALFHLLDTDFDGRLSRTEYLKQVDGGPVLERPQSLKKAQISKVKDQSSPIGRESKSNTEQKKTKPKDETEKNVSKVKDQPSPNRSVKVKPTLTGRENKSKNSNKTQNATSEKPSASNSTESQASKDLSDMVRDIARETAKAVREAMREEMETATAKSVEKAAEEAAGAAANAVFSFSVQKGLKADEAVSQSTVAAAETAVQVAIAEGKKTQDVVDTAVETAEETLMNLGNSTPTKKVDNAVEATREVAISNPKLSNLTAKQKLFVMAEEATTVAVESGTGKDAAQIAVLAANATLQAAAAQAGENRFESIQEMADVAVLAVRKAKPELVGPKLLEAAKDQPRKIATVAQLAGRAAQLAGMSSDETAVVMGLEVAEALPKFDAHDGPEPMAEDATLAALQAAKTLGLTLKQLEAVTMHAAAGGAITGGQIFFLNVQEIAQLAVHAVLATSKGLAEEDGGCGMPDLSC
eukprot:Skav234459  [mRNA]  locus=scaffold1647:166191:169865:+ [translate_table: standard]